MGSRVAGEVESQETWPSREMLTANFGDERLRRRAEKVLEGLSRRPEGSVPSSFQSWGETQAAYRLFSNDNVTGERVLEPHRDATLERMKEFPVVLCVQDTTELDYTSKPQIEGLGPLTYQASSGLHLHPTLAVTPDRLCLGVLDQWSWARDAENHGGKDRHHRLNRPIEEKESLRWLEGYRCVCDLQWGLAETRLVYVADRESDLFELFEQGRSGEAAWLIRASYDRKPSMCRCAGPWPDVPLRLPTRQPGRGGPPAGRGAAFDRHRDGRRPRPPRRRRLLQPVAQGLPARGFRGLHGGLPLERSAHSAEQLLTMPDDASRSSFANGPEGVATPTPTAPAQRRGERRRT